MKRGAFIVLSLVLSMLLVSGVVSARTASGYEPPMPMDFLWIAIILVIVLTIFFVIPAGNRIAQRHKSFFFLLFAVPVMLASVYMGVHTVYENTVSVTKGPVHWHAEYGVYYCGEKLDLVDPQGLRNKIGTPVLHEHDDHWIHVEGTVMQLQDVSLGTYFNVVGGMLTSTSYSYETNEGIVSASNGESCPDGNPGMLSVYVNGNKIEDPAEYVLAPEIFVPNGDCIIIDFSSEAPSETTDKTCISWEARGYTYDDHNNGRRFNN